MVGHWATCYIPIKLNRMMCMKDIPIIHSASEKLMTVILPTWVHAAHVHEKIKNVL